MDSTWRARALKPTGKCTQSPTRILDTSQRTCVCTPTHSRLPTVSAHCLQETLPFEEDEVGISVGSFALVFTMLRLAELFTPAAGAFRYDPMGRERRRCTAYICDYSHAVAAAPITMILGIGEKAHAESEGHTSVFFHVRLSLLIATSLPQTSVTRLCNCVPCLHQTRGQQTL